MSEPAAVLQHNPVLRTGHYSHACPLCQLARTCPEAYEWLEEQLLGPLPAEEGSGTAAAPVPLTQEEIAVELQTRFGILTTQSKISRHKTRHVDPMLAEWRERAVAHLAALQVCGSLSPEQLAQVEAELAIMDARERLDSEEIDDKTALGLHRNIASLSRALAAISKAPLELELLEAVVREKTALAQQSEEAVQALVVQYVKDHAPELLPRLAQIAAGEPVGAGLKPAPAEGGDAA